jgi:hypothetical protein
VSANCPTHPYVALAVLPPPAPTGRVQRVGESSIVSTDGIGFHVVFPAMSSSTRPPKGAPAPRVTIEVEASWLEPDRHLKPSAPAAPGRSVSPQRRNTIEVQADWILDEGTKAGSDRPTAKGRPAGTSTSKKSRASARRPAVPPPLPQEDERATARAARVWEPPSLPPPHPSALRARRVLPPPLPREEDDIPQKEEVPARPSKKRKQPSSSPPTK